MPAIIKKGTPAIHWGTSNQANINAATGCIVESFKVSDKNGSPIEIEDNDGYAAVLVMHDGEFDADLSVMYDSNKTWPAKGDTVESFQQTHERARQMADEGLISISSVKRQEDGLIDAIRILRLA